MNSSAGQLHRDSGMFHVTLDPEGPGVIRLHLRRAEKNLWNLLGKPRLSKLWINGTQLLLLEDSAADIVQSIIETAQDETRPGEEVSLESWRKIKKKSEREFRIFIREPLFRGLKKISIIYTD